MKNTENLTGSLYLTYDSFKHILHASRKGTGTDGFLRYIHQEMTYVLRGGHNPSVWMACFDFPDHRNIPPITTAALKAGDYFDRVMEAVERSGGRCRHTVNLWDALYCVSNDIVPLTPGAEHIRLIERPDYPDPAEGYGANMPRPHYVLPEYRAYIAVETPGGIVLFSHTEEGRRQRQEYELYHERNFFNPAQPDGAFRYWEVVADPFKVQDQVDCIRKAQQQGEGFKAAYVERPILEQGHVLHEYDLTKNANNYALFCQRRAPGALPRKRLGEMTLRDLLTFFQHAGRLRQQIPGQLDNRMYPGEKPHIELVKRGRHL